MPHTLGSDDLLYRVVHPDHWDEGGLKAAAFEDRYDEQSFFVAAKATPSSALLALAPYKPAKKVCGTGDDPPTVARMYASRYRVARVAGSFVLRAIAETNGGNRPITIKPCLQGDYSDNGHLNIVNCKRHSQRFRDEAEILAEEEMELTERSG